MQVPLGVQIWSLKNELQANPVLILEKLVNAGYTFIEPSGFNAIEKTMQGLGITQLKQFTSALGLDILSGHFSFGIEDVHTVCKSAVAMGMKYIVHSFLKDDFEHTIDNYKQAAEKLNYIGETAKSYGLQLAYHNHAHEFEYIMGNTIPYNVLLENTDPNLVKFQADLGWMIYANVSPVDYFTNYTGRFPLWHLRDIDPQTKKSVTIGQGMVDFPGINTSTKKAGLQYKIVEISSATEQPLAKIIDSAAFILKNQE